MSVIGEAFSKRMDRLEAQEAEVLRLRGLLHDAWCVCCRAAVLTPHADEAASIRALGCRLKKAAGPVHMKPQALAGRSVTG